MPILSNPKHELFAQELAKGKNATEAYEMVFEARGAAARANASRLLTNANVQDRVAEILQVGAERAEITAERVLRELAKIAFCDIRKAVQWGMNPGDKSSENADPNGLNIYPVSLVPSERIDDDTAAAVSEVSLTQTGVKIKMHDKRAALVDIGKHLGMFVERVENININHDVTDEPLSDHEWAERHTAH
jgi:phage terminase small subunit